MCLLLYDFRRRARKHDRESAQLRLLCQILKLLDLSLQIDLGRRGKRILGGGRYRFHFAHDGSGGVFQSLGG